MVFANGAAVGEIPPSSDFFRSLSLWEPTGSPCYPTPFQRRQADTVQLAAGT
jgi:hypothetical protein